jgi:hypothetical protein
MAPPKLSVAEYDKLSPEQKKAYDSERAETEAAEQAGVLCSGHFWCFVLVLGLG